jgi:hypothetical protein
MATLWVFAAGAAASAGAAGAGAAGAQPNSTTAVIEQIKTNLTNLPVFILTPLSNIKNRNGRCTYFLVQQSKHIFYLFVSSFKILGFRFMLNYSTDKCTI